MKCRVYYKADGNVIITYLIEEGRRKEESDKSFLDREMAKTTDLAALEYDDIDETDLPDSQWDKWRGSKGNGVHIDDTVITNSEKLAALNEEIDDELIKADTDVNLVKIERLMRKIEKREYLD